MDYCPKKRKFLGVIRTCTVTEWKKMCTNTPHERNFVSIHGNLFVKYMIAASSSSCALLPSIGVLDPSLLRNL